MGNILISFLSVSLPYIPPNIAALLILLIAVLGGIGIGAILFMYWLGVPGRRILKANLQHKPILFHISPDERAHILVPTTDINGIWKTGTMTLLPDKTYKFYGHPAAISWSLSAFTPKAELLWYVNELKKKGFRRGGLSSQEAGQIAGIKEAGYDSYNVKDLYDAIAKDMVTTQKEMEQLEIAIKTINQKKELDTEDKIKIAENEGKMKELADRLSKLQSARFITAQVSNPRLITQDGRSSLVFDVPLTIDGYEQFLPAAAHPSNLDAYKNFIESAAAREIQFEPGKAYKWVTLAIVVLLVMVGLSVFITVAFPHGLP